VLARLLAAEAAGLAGRPDALRCLVRFADTRAAQLLHAVDDLLLEAARRRSAPAAAARATSPARGRADLSDHANGPPEAAAPAPVSEAREARAAGPARQHDPKLGVDAGRPLHAAPAAEPRAPVLGSSPERLAGSGGPADGAAPAPARYQTRDASGRGRGGPAMPLGSGLWWPARASPAGAGRGLGGPPADAAAPGQGRGCAGEPPNGAPVAGGAPAAARSAPHTEESSYDSDGSSTSGSYSTSAGSGSDAGSGSGSSDGSGAGSEDGRARARPRGMGGSAGQAPGRGLEVQLQGLKLDCLDALEPARLVLQARRALRRPVRPADDGPCGTARDASLSSARVAAMHLVCVPVMLHIFCLHVMVWDHRADARPGMLRSSVISRAMRARQGHPQQSDACRKRRQESAVWCAQVACTRCQRAGNMALATEAVAAGAQARDGMVSSTCGRISLNGPPCAGQHINAPADRALAAWAPGASAAAATRHGGSRSPRVLCTSAAQRSGC